MKTKYNYNLKDTEILKSLAFKELDEKVKILPEFDDNCNEVQKKNKYKEYILREISILKFIKFDGYLFMLKEIIHYAKNMNISVEVYGTVQNSLVAYLLGISSKYDILNIDKFIDFTPFTQNPTVNIIIENARKSELMDFIEFEYKDFIKSRSEEVIEFKELLKLKFIDLEIGKQNSLSEEDARLLGFKVLKPDINLSYQHAQFINENQILLGFDSLNIEDFLGHLILQLREKKIGKVEWDDIQNDILTKFDLDKTEVVKLKKLIGV